MKGPQLKQFLGPQPTVPVSEQHERQEQKQRVIQEQGSEKQSDGLPRAPVVPRDGSPTVMVVTGTYNRMRLLKDAIYSIRRATGGIDYEIVVVDGGSKDGTRHWLHKQDDIHVIEQELPLSGAVSAFNLGFAYAVDRDAQYVMHLNDDCIIESKDAIVIGAEILAASSSLGAVAYAFDLRGKWNHEYVNGFPYVNFGIIRAKAGKEVARRQGDPTGRAWWNPIYRTYGADSEFGAWLHVLGWGVHKSNECRVHDRAGEVNDELRRLNQSNNPNRHDSILFWKRWPSKENVLRGPVDIKKCR